MTAFETSAGRDALDRWIDRQEAFCESLGDRGFLTHLSPTLELLDRPGPVADILAELRDEERRDTEAFNAAQRAALRSAERWAERLESAAPAARGGFEAIRADIRTAGITEQGIGPNATLEPTTPARRCINRLDSAACSAVDAGQISADLVDRLRGDMYPLTHAERAHALRVQTSAAFALERLESIAAHINPPDHEAYNRGQYPRALGVGGIFDRLVFEGEETVDSDVVARLITMTRADLRRLLLELRRRLDLTRSRLATVRRFSTWASWYGRDELRRVVDENPGQAEELLTKRLASFLFDHGHTPLSKPLVGRVEPDLLDASTLQPLYVEAKQYADPQQALTKVAQGLRQAADTASLLVGTELSLEEAFVVVFVRGGPRLDVPEAVRIANLTVHVVVVDVVEWERVGSRRRENPISVTTDELITEIGAQRRTPEPGTPTLGDG